MPVVNLHGVLVMFSPYDINDYSILNPGAHFVGDVASAHIGEKYVYSGKISELIFYTGGRLSF